MPVTNITVSQDNIVDGCSLLAIHSPLVFIIDVTYSGSVPVLHALIRLENFTMVESDSEFNCIFYRDLSPTVRQFIFIADPILRAYMDDFNDFLQTAESVAVVQKVQKKFVIEFNDYPNIDEWDYVYLTAFAASRQFGQTPALTEIYTNVVDTYICAAEMPVYIYFYNNTAAVLAKIKSGATEWSFGSEIVLKNEDMTSWEGVPYETVPSNWIIRSNVERDADWRLYESSAGIGKFYLLNPGGYYGKYYAIYWDAVRLDIGADNYYFEIKYKGLVNGNYLMAGYMLEGGGIAWGGTAITDSVDWKTIQIKIWNPGPLPLGNRFPLIGFYIISNDYSVEVEVDYIKLYKAASQIGYYRLKLDDLTEDADFEFYQDSVLKAIKHVRVKEFCTDDKYVKYLDKIGQYRFYVFNRFFETRDNPSLIGRTNKFITSILDSQTNKKNLGYKNERRLTLVTDEVTADELLVLSDIYTSPRVYLYIGDGSTDLDSDWLEVTVESKDNLVRQKKGGSSSVVLDVILPERFNITML